MCAIVDANVRDLVFKRHARDASDANARFFQWIISGKGIVVIGGTKLRKELYGDAGWRLRDVFVNLRRMGYIKDIDDEEVDRVAEQLCTDGACKSDDEHIIALARVSRARLLYSHDSALHRDFGNRDLLSKPLGKVYSTRTRSEFTDGHQRLLANRNLCDPRRG